MENRILHNVAICPWAREGPMRGCTVPGTDNSEADTADNQAGLWALPATNHIIGNRFANSFNGLFIQSNFNGGVGRGAVEGGLCTEMQPFGRVQGNTCHGHGRFGTYLLGPNYPRSIDATVQSNGVLIDVRSCDAFTADGSERGVSAVLADSAWLGSDLSTAAPLGFPPPLLLPRLLLLLLPRLLLLAHSRRSRRTQARLTDPRRLRHHRRRQTLTMASSLSGNTIPATCSICATLP